ncbi:hypothetical protein JYK00_02860 [Thermosipho ferrireducens]|uniref:Glycosyl transferase family 1 domain-containing protein n=1 Tax=Thermosipho ferrireducens TaxID=2571116 RepID=A0ABX7S9B6_9BACT|nr:hypothetical protein [Thermosipho ferrireducens]QTA38481.1 hypothetical protein JYK00_02860 [Thermosipho ferrireducens]
MKSIISNAFGTYKKIYKKNYPWVLVSYLTLPFYLKKIKRYMLAHQNRYGALVLFECFKRFNFNYYGIQYNKTNLKINLDKEQVKIVFGIEPNFLRLSNYYPDSIKIYFATGAYYKHQNKMIISRTDEVNKKKKANLKYVRMVPEHNSAEIADYIFQIGSKYTIETYPSNLRSKIRLVRQGTFDFLKYNEKLKKEKFNDKVFLWFGGKGAILKGLDLVLDYFSKNDEYKLHVVGPVEPDFQKIFEKELFYTSNIYFHGSLKIHSKKLYEISLETSFIILPSASEGGVPGSVLNMMRLGMIPLVSKYAAFDEIEDYGYLIKDLSVDGIKEVIEKTKRLTSDELIKIFKKNSEYAQGYSYNNFYLDVKNELEKIKLN